MQKLIRNWCLVVLLSLVLGTPLAIAKGKGQQHGSDRPPGWDKGEKKGWHSNVPPGQEKKEEMKKAEKKKKEKQEKKKAK